MKKAVLSLALTGGLLWALGTSFSPLPALGAFLSPFSGFWSNERRIQMLDAEIHLPGVESEVIIRYDDNRVPHIFAENDHDLYYAQGYVTARDRLFQMDLTIRSAAGRLSEVVGEQALPLDLYKRRTGSVKAAEEAWKFVQQDVKVRRVIEAYSDGINAYLSNLRPADYPIEYKMLGFTPEAWTPEKSMLLMVEMTHTLATPRDGDAALTNVLQKFGLEVLRDLYPDYADRESPIIPKGTKWNFKRKPLPKVPKDYTEGTASVREPLSWPERVEGIGSNNWAIAGEKSATGLPILAGDPHLGLTLPSIWYQIQLSTPESNAYGVSLPGAPCIIIGFNHDIAWSETNVGSDVADLYAIKFKDASRREYSYDGQWVKTDFRLEEIKVKGKPSVIDTVVYTHHGPVAMPRWGDEQKPSLALRWIAHEPGNPVKTFYMLNRSKNYDDYVRALSHYVAPAQNFVFASNENDIAIWVNGKFPLKWKEQGKFLLDGSKAAHDWQGWIPHAHNPHVKNPKQGYVSSANQAPADESYPYYLHWRFAAANRAIRINERLEGMQQATIDSLRLLQNDTYNVLARDLLPTLLEQIKMGDLNASQYSTYTALKQWDYEYTTQAVAPTIFEKWVENLPFFVWDEFTTDAKKPLQLPQKDRLWQLILKEPDSKWFDRVETADVKENQADIIRLSFKATVDSLTRQYGTYSSKNWAWGAVKGSTIAHLVPPLKSFGRSNVVAGGGADVPNAFRGKWGPSWRMVVALGKDGPKAYGVYPGGQSGNPGSPYYDNMVTTWAEGKLNELVYLKTIDENHPKVLSTLKISKR
ncbi:penicillin acylase family protein [Siphonobacter curvatus]|uniref:Penicillin acylase family protein n=1 Tax=Siphonobacter curvatus TaxID=2094562 RepID=A0A2S7IIV1_9BACT|nr:penicillin acylase family protein [Siphonobacter curvatus]PQA56320.1 penicillin acylase family protein [Siphonobacter curvatus]